MDHLRPEDVPHLKGWADLWVYWVSATYVDAYLKTVEPAGIVPRDLEDVGLLLNAILLQRAVYEIDYELNNRPAWLKLPLQGVIQMLDGKAA